MEGTAQLQIKLLSAKDLWTFNFFQKLCIYATASLFSDAVKLSKDQMQEQRTATDPDGDGHPDWDHLITFRLSSDLPSPISDLILRFELRHYAGLLFPDRTIGEVKVPLSDLLQSSDSFRFVDYQVRSTDGKPNGVLRLAYKLNRSVSGESDGSPLVITGYPHINPDEKPTSLYPTADLWEPSPIPIPTVEASPGEYQTHLPSEPSAPPAHQYPSVPHPMWAPPPPPPPFWGPPGLMHRPPPPPPGYFHYEWGYQQQTEGQQNNGR